MSATHTTGKPPASLARAATSSPAAAPGGRFSLRHAGIGRKLALMAGAGVLATVAVAGVGLTGLGSVDSRAQDLSGLADALQHAAALRDGEGDMRVNVYAVVEAGAGAGVQQALADTKDTDATVSSQKTGCRSSIAVVGSRLIRAMSTRHTTMRMPLTR